MSKKNKETTLKDVGTAIGVGLIAGFAGTFAITVSQRIEMEITGRKPSDTPANAVREVLDVKPVSESKSQQVSQEVHWAYGTSFRPHQEHTKPGRVKRPCCYCHSFFHIVGRQIHYAPFIKSR